MTQIVDSDEVVVAGDAFTFKNTLTLDGAVYPLTDKTITARIRREGDDSTVIHATLEDLAVTLGNTNTATADGGVTLAITGTQSALLAPSGASIDTGHRTYLLEYHVMPDDVTPEALRITVRRGLA